MAEIIGLTGAAVAITWCVIEIIDGIIGLVTMWRGKTYDYT